MAVATASKPVNCEREIASRVTCGALVAIPTPTGWEVVCPRCKKKVVLESSREVVQGQHSRLIT